jgi:uncharacterized protein YcbX
MNYKLSEIYLYPIKSLGGILVESAEVTDRGLKHDRRWMLVDENNQFLTQRTHHKMALLQVSIEEEKLIVNHKDFLSEKISIPLNQELFTNEISRAAVWDDEVMVKVYNDKINNWFSQQLSTKCKLVYMPDTSIRMVDINYAENGEVTSLSDGYPFLIIGQESLNYLNSKLAPPIPMNRFRPNFVFKGGTAHDEDEWHEFKIGDVTFFGVKPCSRCVVTTIDQQTGFKNKEPLQTLSSYRNFDGKIMFGMNLLHKGSGIIKAGDDIIV